MKKIFSLSTTLVAVVMALFFKLILLPLKVAPIPEELGPQKEGPYSITIPKIGILKIQT